MERISIKKKIDQLIISHKIEKNEQISSVEFDIVNKAEIPALLPVQLHRSLIGKEFRFVVKDYIDLRSFLKSDIRFDLFAEIVLQIVDALQDCEAHGIRCGNLELSSDLSFYDYSKRQVRLIYWPLISLEEYPNISAFFLELGSLYTSRGNDCDYRLRYLKFFDSRAKFDLESFKQHVNLLLKKKEEGQGGSSFDVRKKNGINADKIAGLSPTVGLRTASLQRMSDQTMIYISRYPFSIGRNAMFCDYAIEDNHYISKKHITILMRNGEAYIRDNSSANGTFLNGTRIPPNAETKLLSGARIRIGNEDFTFHTSDG